MSHQLNLIMPSGMKWMGGIINFFHSRLIKKFNAIWVPDAQNSVLSGELSRSNLRVEFVGVLSRFEKSIEIQQVNKLVVVLSGPEPQRTLLEKNLLPQVIALNLPSIFVRGLLNEKMGESEIDQVKIVNYLKSDTLQNVMEQSEIIISRSGYSTIMDLAVLKKKAILIPTPGQPEQEYLASKYMNDRIAYSTDQEVLDLADALELSTEYLGFEHKASDELLLKAFDKVGL
jgi:UDP-N-acetylglucosamine transferase subunit ALG13